MDKVRGGTPRGNSSESMCKSCRSAHVAHGVNNQEIVFCRAEQPFRVTFPVVECSVYDDKRNPPLYEMQQIAWVVQSRNRGPIGFTDGRTMEITIEPPNPYGVPQQQPTTGGKDSCEA